MSEKQVTLKSSNLHHSKTALVDLPNYCPWCHKLISPNILVQTSFNATVDEHGCLASFILGCPDCMKHFLYSIDTTFISGSSKFEYIPVTEKPIPKSDFIYPSEIDEISKEFGNIISQSAHAEGLGLNHLAGIGYRKSIEFLLKDYLIVHKKLDKEKISKNTLGQCISQDITDSRLQALARAATWIGNDETHYVRKHEDKDISDMKKFLHNLTLFISYELSIKEALEFTNDTN